MRMLSRRLLLVAVAVAVAGTALAACGGVFTHDDSGQTQSVSLVSSLSPGEVHDRTIAWFAREGYGLVDVSDQLVRADKQRALASGGGQQRDVVSVNASLESGGTRVTIDLLTYLIENGMTRQAPQVSAEARSDADRLAQALMSPRP
jgi:hypothetical protein